MYVWIDDEFNEITMPHMIEIRSLNILEQNPLPNPLHNLPKSAPLLCLPVVLLQLDCVALLPCLHEVVCRGEKIHSAIVISYCPPQHFTLLISLSLFCRYVATVPLFPGMLLNLKWVWKTLKWHLPLTRTWFNEGI
ncbi:hypothetical protein TSUD_195480 [Trifolium subterraneum]|nr:hypothetical protein TSUD_195480 [Trifolium subterraneum]